MCMAALSLSIGCGEKMLNTQLPHWHLHPLYISCVRRVLVKQTPAIPFGLVIAGAVASRKTPSYLNQCEYSSVIFPLIDSFPLKFIASCISWFLTWTGYNVILDSSEPCTSDSNLYWKWYCRLVKFYSWKNYPLQRISNPIWKNWTQDVSISSWWEPFEDIFCNINWWSDLR